MAAAKNEESYEHLLKKLCDNSALEKLSEIYDQYEAAADKQQGSLRAILSYTVPPTEEQLEGIRSFIINKYGVREGKLVFEQRRQKQSAALSC